MFWLIFKNPQTSFSLISKQSQPLFFALILPDVCRQDMNFGIVKKLSIKKKNPPFTTRENSEKRTKIDWYRENSKSGKSVLCVVLFSSQALLYTSVHRSTHTRQWCVLDITSVTKTRLTVIYLGEEHAARFWMRIDMRSTENRGRNWKW